MGLLHQQRIDWVLEYGSSELVRGLRTLGNTERIVMESPTSKRFLELVLDRKLPASSEYEAFIHSNYTTDEIFTILEPLAMEGLGGNIKPFYNFFYFGIYKEDDLKLFGTQFYEQDVFDTFCKLPNYPYSSQRLDDLVIGRHSPSYFLYHVRDTHTSRMV